MREMRNWREYLIERFTADREEAIGFLQAVMEDYQAYGNSAAVESAVHVVVESHGGVEKVANRTPMSPETLSKILSSEKALHLDTFAALLKALGCRLSIEPLKTEGCGADHVGVDASVAPIKSTKSDIALTTHHK